MSPDGQLPTAFKYSLIGQWPLPTCQSSLTSFIGICRFYWQFFPWYEVNLPPFRSLIKKYNGSKIPLIAWSTALLDKIRDAPFPIAWSIAELTSLPALYLEPACSQCIFWANNRLCMSHVPSHSKPSPLVVIVVPRSLRLHVLCTLHAAPVVGHMGYYKTFIASMSASSSQVCATSPPNQSRVVPTASLQIQPSAMP